MSFLPWTREYLRVSFWPNFIQYLPEWFIFFSEIIINICYFADDTTPYVNGTVLNFVLEKLEE